MTNRKGQALFRRRMPYPRGAALARFRAMGLASLAILLALHSPAHATQTAQKSAGNVNQHADRPGQAAPGVDNSARRSAGFKRLDPRKNFSERMIETALFPLKVGTYSLNQKIREGTAFLVAGNRILVADRTGGFAELDMSEPIPSIRTLPLRIDLYEKQLLDYAAGRGAVDFYLLRVLDLASVNDGRQFAVSYTRWDREKKCVSLFVAMNDLPADWRAIDPAGWRIIFESQPCLPLQLDGTSLFAGHQSGGRLLEIAPDTLALTVGDFEYDGVNRTPIYPQDAASDYGKVLELEWKTGTRKVLSMGHRNPQGLAMDASRHLWSTEHGPNGGDELNLIVPGSNYGWPLLTYGINYDSAAWPLAARSGRHEDPAFRAPAYAWVPSIGISNLIAVKDFAPEWEGDLLVASLRGEQLRHLRVHGESVIYDEPIDLGARLRDIGQLADGRIVIWADGDSLIVLDRQIEEGNGLDERVAVLPAKVRAAVQSCMQCHSLGSGAEGGKIGLAGIHGRNVGSADSDLYSSGLKARQGAWDDKSLDGFLQDPKGWVPGTTMQFSGIKDDEVRGSVIAFLRTLKKRRPGA